MPFRHAESKTTAGDDRICGEQHQHIDGGEFAKQLADRRRLDIGLLLSPSHGQTLKMPRHFGHRTLEPGCSGTRSCWSHAPHLIVR